MLSLQQFTALTRDEKQGALVSLFSQLHDETHPNQEVDDVLFMLQANDAYSDHTLESLYEGIVTILGMKKDDDEKSIAAQMHKIHTKLEQETLQSQEEADSMLTNI